MDKSLAEFIGTFALVFFGCGAAVIGGMGSAAATAIDLLGIATAFGLAIVAMAYGIGPISGCHVNPAVSFGVYVAGAMSLEDMIRYWIAQILGAIVGAIVLYVILSGKAQGWNGSLGQDGWGKGYLGEYNALSAFVFEVVATFLFLICILGVTQQGYANPPGRIRRCRDRSDPHRDPYRRHQYHGSFRQSGAVDRSGAGRLGLESECGRAIVALHHRADDRRRRSRDFCSEPARWLRAATEPRRRPRAEIPRSRSSRERVVVRASMSFPRKRESSREAVGARSEARRRRPYAAKC